MKVFSDSDVQARPCQSHSCFSQHYKSLFFDSAHHSLLKQAEWWDVGHYKKKSGNKRALFSTSHMLWLLQSSISVTESVSLYSLSLQNKVLILGGTGLWNRCSLDLLIYFGKPFPPSQSTEVRRWKVIRVKAVMTKNVSKVSVIKYQYSDVIYGSEHYTRV
ncbi:hypothetical protein VNO77_21885 [Canavalia gladiata]|uniref:Uncharacterized protein n=1 Tax=Canavalia gladiata TaxID=3824 RepID=A0AAN9L208_CANGL